MIAANSISSSASTKGKPSRAASRRPTVDLPTPIMPTRTMGQLIAGLKDFRFRCMAGAAIQRPAHTANCLFIWLRRQARLEINRSLEVGNGYEEQKNKPQQSRSEESSVGKECGSTGGEGWWADKE